MDDRLAAVLEDLTALQRDLAAALAAGDDARAERLLAELSILERRRNRLVHRSLQDPPAYSTTMSFRDQVVRTLTLLGRPASAALVSDTCKARWGEPIPTRRLSSLRRDEQVSWEASPGGRATYVTSGLTGERFAPVRGSLALSTWGLEWRILAPASPRVDLLVNLVNLTNELGSGRAAGASWVAAEERLVVRLARTVPNALGSDGYGDPLDLDRIVEACQVELAALEPGDRRERSSAAQRAAECLDDHQKLFGVRLRVIPGDRVEGRRA